jgi:hypothetical protein
VAWPPHGIGEHTKIKLHAFSTSAQAGFTLWLHLHITEIALAQEAGRTSDTFWVWQRKETFSETVRN